MPDYNEQARQLRYTRHNPRYMGTMIMPSSNSVPIPIYKQVENEPDHPTNGPHPTD